MTTLFSPNSQTQFIEDALFCTTPLALSYSDPDQKWIIRQHLLSLFQNCPYLKPTIAVFTHNDGAHVKLIAASGSLPASPPVPLTVWLHELYPHAPPLVFVDAHTIPFPIYHNHPFVDPTSGAATSAYLITWDPDTSNLTDLVRSLVKLFNHCHPFYHVDNGRRCCQTFNYSALSKTDAMDHLAEALFHDLRAATAENEAEIGRIAAVQARLQERAEKAAFWEAELKSEKMMLKEKVNRVCVESDRVLEWVKVYENWNLDIDGVFEGSDKKSEEVMESKAGAKAMEDLMYTMDKALEEGVVGFGEYIKEVRKMAREQYVWKEKMRRIEGGCLFLQLGSSSTVGFE